MNRNNIFFVATCIVFTIFLLFRVDDETKSYNDMSRLAGVISISRYNELNIDKTNQKITMDRAEYKGKAYSSKPPVLNFVLGHLIHVGFQIKPALLNNDIAIYRASAALTAVFPLVGIFIVFYLLFRKTTKKFGVKSVFFSLFLVIGTLLFSYSRNLNNHILEAFLQLSLFYLILQRSKKSSLLAVLIGFLLSALFVIDITYGFVAIPITLLYLFFTDRKWLLSNFLFIVLSGIPLTVLHFYLNYVQFETLLPPQLFPEKYQNFAGSIWIEGGRGGMESQNHPIWLRFINYTFGTYGFFLYQPLLILPFLVKANYKKKEFIYVCSLVLGYVLFNTIMQGDYAGSTFGPRRFLPLIPICYFFVVKNLGYYLKSTNGKVVIFVFLVLNFSLSILGYKNAWSNWDLVDGDDKHLYFPLLYTLRKFFHFKWIDSVANWLEPMI